MGYRWKGIDQLAFSMRLYGRHQVEYTKCTDRTAKARVSPGIGKFKHKWDRDLKGRNIEIL